MRFDNHWAGESSLSNEPTQLDTMQRFDNYNNGIRSPMIPYESNQFENTRASFPITILSNLPGSAQVAFTVTENVVLPPFLFQRGTENNFGLSGVDKYTLTLNFGSGASGLSRIWCHDNVGSAANNVIINPSSGINVAVTACVAHPIFLAPLPSPEYKLPAVLFYPYYNIDRYITDTPLALAPQYPPASASSQQVTIQNL